MGVELDVDPVPSARAVANAATATAATNAMTRDPATGDRRRPRSRGDASGRRGMARCEGAKRGSLRAATVCVVGDARGMAL